MPYRSIKRIDNRQGASPTPPRHKTRWNNASRQLGLIPPLARDATVRNARRTDRPARHTRLDQGMCPAAEAAMMLRDAEPVRVQSVSSASFSITTESALKHKCADDMLELRVIRVH